MQEVLLELVIHVHKYQDVKFVRLLILQFYVIVVLLINLLLIIYCIKIDVIVHVQHKLMLMVRYVQPVLICVICVLLQLVYNVLPIIISTRSHVFNNVLHFTSKMQLIA